MQTHPAEHAEDLALVRSILRGDERAVDRFVQRMRCIPRILEALDTRLGRPLKTQDLADLAQDTMAVVWRKLDTYAGRASLESWVYAFCTFELMNAIRSHRRLPRPVPDAAHVVGAAPLEAPPIPSVEYEEVYLGLEGLHSAQAEVIRLKHFESMNFQEIARALSISPNTAKTHYYRGIERMRALLRPHYQERYA